MAGLLEVPTALYTLIGCTAGLLLMLLVCVCMLYKCKKEKNNKQYFKKMQESVEMDSLLFSYEKSTEKQQSSQQPAKALTPMIYAASCPASPSNEHDTSIKKSSSYLEISNRYTDDENMNQYRRFSVNPKELDLRLYQTEEELTSSPYSGLGRISFQLSYDKPNEKLTVHVYKGTNIQAKSNSSPNPYLKVCLLPDKKRRMHSKTRKGENPIFNEDFVFSVPLVELSKRILRIAVCDFDRFSRQTVLGYVVLCLTDEIEKITEVNGTGEIWKDLTDNDAMPGLKKGELLFSLSHLPTAERMTVSVIKAKELNIKWEKENGVAIKVNLVLNGKVIKSKKTSTIKLSLNESTFNESFVYELPNDILERASFIFIVYAYNNNHKRIIGKANTGPYMYSTGTGLSHWNEMLMQPRSTVSHWHTLM